MQLSKALDQVFAPGLDETVIATLPDYWQVYFATKAGKIQEARIDNSVLRPGSGVVSPKLLSSLEPASNDYAQKNNIAGMTLLSTVVGASGKPGSVTIVRPIGFGLDEQAVDAVERAHFRPGMHDGQPVPVVVNVQVTFRIYSERTRPQPGGAPPTPPANPASAPAPAHWQWQRQGSRPGLAAAVVPLSGEVLSSGKLPPVSHQFIALVRRGATTEIAEQVEHDPSIAQSRDAQGVSALLWAVYSGQDRGPRLPALRPRDARHLRGVPRSATCRKLRRLYWQLTPPLPAQSVSRDGWPALHLAAAFGGCGSSERSSLSTARMFTQISLCHAQPAAACRSCAE